MNPGRRAGGKFLPGLHLLDGPSHLVDLLLQPCDDVALLSGAGVGTLRRSRAVRGIGVWDETSLALVFISLCIYSYWTWFKHAEI